MIRIIYPGQPKPEHLTAFGGELTVRVLFELGAAELAGEYVIEELNYRAEQDDTVLLLNGPNPSITRVAQDQVRIARRSLERALDGVADEALRAQLQAVLASIPVVEPRPRRNQG